MAPPTLLIRDIHPTTPRPWTAKVMVVEKAPPRDSQTSPTKYQKYVIVDSMGGKVELTLFNSSIGMFNDRLQLNKVYHISNANVRESPSNFRFGNTAYQWSLHNTCMVEEVVDDGGAPAVHAYNFIGSDQIIAYKDSPTTIDLLVIALRMLPKKQVNTKVKIIDLQEFIVIDKSMKPFVLTLWDKFTKSEAMDLTSVIDAKPVVAALRVKPVPYDGITVNSRTGSNFLINPPIPDAVDMRTWLYDNMDAVNALLNSDDLITDARNFGKDATSAITTISAIARQPHLRLFNVKATITLTNFTQPFVYMSCNLCTGKTSAPFNDMYICNFCKKPAVSTPRMRAEVCVRDSTAGVTATLTGLDAELFTGCDAGLVHQNSLQAHPTPMENLMNGSKKEDVYVQLRAYKSEYMGITSRKFGAYLIDPPIVDVQPPITADVATLNAPVVAAVCTPVIPTVNAAALQTSNLILLADDPDLTDEERLVVNNLVSRKKRITSLAQASSNPQTVVSEESLSTTSIQQSSQLLNTGHALINENFSVSPVTELPESQELPANLIARVDLEEFDIHASTYEESVINQAGDDDWDALLLGPEAAKIKNTGTSKAKRKLVLDV